MITRNNCKYSAQGNHIGLRDGNDVDFTDPDDEAALTEVQAVTVAVAALYESEAE